MVRVKWAKWVCALVVVGVVVAVTVISGGTTLPYILGGLSVGGLSGLTVFGGMSFVERHYEEQLRDRHTSQTNTEKICAQQQENAHNQAARIAVLEQNNEQARMANAAMAAANDRLQERLTQRQRENAILQAQLVEEQTKDIIHLQPADAQRPGVSGRRARA